jgi:fucose permease
VHEWVSLRNTGKNGCASILADSQSLSKIIIGCKNIVHPTNHWYDGGINCFTIPRKLATGFFVTLPSTTVSTRFTRTYLTWFAYLCAGSYAYQINILGPILPFLRGEMQLSYAVSSLHTSAFAVGMMIAGSLADQVARYLGRKHTIWLGMLGLAIGSLLLITGWHPLITILGTLLMGTVGTLVMVTSNALLAEQYGEQAPFAFAESNVIGGIFAILAPLLVGLASQSVLTWRAALAVALLFMLLLYGHYRRIDLTTGRQTARTRAAAAAKRLPRRYWRFWLVILTVVAVEFCLIAWAATFLEVNAAVAREQAALILSLFFLAMLLGRWLGTIIVRWVAPRRLLLLTVVLCAAGFLLHWLSTSPILSVIGLFVAGLGVANHFPLAMGLAVSTAPDQTDAASARVVIASGSAILTLPLLLGGLADWVGLWPAYGIVLPLLVIAAGLVLATE